MSSTRISSSRRIIARVLLIVSLPIVFLGLIDPLEGGIALLLSVATLSFAFLAAGYWPRKTLWVPFLLAIVVGAIALLVAIFGLDRADNASPMFPLITLIWLYRALVVAALVGLAMEVIRIFKASKFEISQGTE